MSAACRGDQVSWPREGVTILNQLAETLVSEMRDRTLSCPVEPGIEGMVLLAVLMHQRCRISDNLREFGLACAAADDSDRFQHPKARRYVIQEFTEALKAYDGQSVPLQLMRCST